MGRISKLRTYIVCAIILCYPIVLFTTPQQASALTTGECEYTGGNQWQDISTWTNPANWSFGAIKMWSTQRVLKITVDYDATKMEFSGGSGLNPNSNITYPSTGRMQIDWVNKSLSWGSYSNDQLTAGYNTTTANIFAVKTKAQYTNTSVDVRLYESGGTYCRVGEHNTTYRGFTSPTYTPPVVIPPAPVLTGEAGETSNTLNWTATTGATSYKLRIGSQVIYEGPQTTYNHTGLTSGTEYIYKVYAVNSAGESPQSNDLTLTTTVPPPPPETITERDKHMLALAMSTAIGWTAVRSFRWRGTE